MPIPSIYINLEDDVSKIVERVKKERSSELILVCPKRCFLFNDSINLRLLKKQADMLSKKVFVLTMDERGQAYAKEAGFELKQLPKAGGARGFSDIAPKSKTALKTSKPAEEVAESPAQKVIHNLQNLTKGFVSSEAVPEEEARVQPEEKVTKKSDSLKPEVLKNTESVFPKELEDSYKHHKKRRRTTRLLGLFALAAVVLTFSVVFVLLPKAEVVIYAKTQKLTRDLVISASTKVTAPDSDALLIPAQKISQAVTAQGTFQSQGKKEVGNKAEGSVVIYNFTGAPLSLKTKTTLLVLNNKNYVLKNDALLIKPTKYKNSKTKEVDENSLTPAIDVEAELGGESYNIPAGTRLEITNQVFGSRPQLLYAKASVAITGGTSRYLSLVSEQDIEQAKAGLTSQIQKDLSAQLAEKNLVIDVKALQLQNPQFSFDHDAGTETPEFGGKVTAQAFALAYNSQDLEKVVLERIKKSLSSENKIEVKLASPLSLQLRPVDFSQELMVMDVHFDGLAEAVNSNIGDLNTKLLGKTKQAAADYVKSVNSVDKVEITLSPGWQSWLPWLKSNIHIIEK